MGQVYLCEKKARNNFAFKFSRIFNVKVLVMLVLVFSCLFLGRNEVEAAPVYRVFGANDTFDSSYGYTVDLNNISLDMIETSGGFRLVASQQFTASTTLTNFFTLSFPNGNGDWIKYKNVGSWNGQAVDLKITVISCDGCQVLDRPAPYNNIQPQLIFLSDSYNFYEMGLNGLKLKYEYVASGTDTPIDYRGYFTFLDIDMGQYVVGLDNVSALYITQNTALMTSGDRVTSDKSYDNPTANLRNKAYAVQAFINNGAIFQLSSERWNEDLCLFSIGMVSLAPFNQSDPNKASDKNVVTVGDTVEFRVSQFVPMEDEEYLYSYFSISDIVPDAFAVQSGVKVLDQWNADVSYKFNISVSGNNVSVTAKNEWLGNQTGFYCNTYTLVIPCTVTKNLAGYTTDRGTFVSNYADVATSRSEKRSNTSELEVKFRITTEIDHGTITPDEYDIPGGSDRSVSFQPAPGYHVSDVVVDGKSVYDDSFKNGGHIDFNDMDDNHDVVVSCERIPAKVTVKHITDKTRKDLCSPETLNGYVLDPYTTHEKQFEGYRLKEIPDNASGTFTEEGITVVYVYELILQDINIHKTLEATASTSILDLSGAKFKVTATYFSDLVQLENPETVYYSTVTDSSGRCTVSGLPFGTYSITEETIPDLVFNGQLRLNGSGTFSTSCSVTIDEERSFTFNIENLAKKMRIIVYKEDIETGTTTQGDAHLEGAQYTIYRDSSCTDAVETITTHKNGDGTYSAESGWYLVGTYYVKETKPPEGYLIDPKVYTVSQDAASQTVEKTDHTITSKDEVKRNDIEITKYIEKTDSTPKFKLSGAVFTASLDSDPSQTWVSTTTDDNGYCIIKQLPYGRYTIRETTIPDIAYNGEFWINGVGERTQTFQEFVELDDTERGPYVWSDLTDVAKKMRITIVREDDETGKNKQGDANLNFAEYTLYRDPECTDPIETVVIEEQPDGTHSAKSGWYLVGAYYIKETKVSEGYIPDDKVYKVEQIPRDQHVERTEHTLTVDVKCKEGIIKVIKYENNNEITGKNSATGAKLRLTLNSRPNVYYEAVVNEYGYLEFVDKTEDTWFSTENNCPLQDCYPYTIPYGAYTITEIETGESHEAIFIDPQETEIREQGQIQRYILDDEYIHLKFKLEKEDTETKKQIPLVAKFKLWDVKNERWHTERVYGSGEIIDEFSTNAQGEFYLAEILDAGEYIIYETQAPYGYFLDENMRYPDGSGYKFAVSVSSKGEVTIEHNGEEEVLEYEMGMYENEPSKIFKYTAVIEDLPQKATIEITKKAMQYARTEIKPSEYGNITVPVLEEKGLQGVTYRLKAAEDIVTPDGTTRYTENEIVEDNLVTDENGKVKTKEVYLGRYLIEEVESVNGYILDSTPIEVNIEYTNQYEKVQDIRKSRVNRKQPVKLEIEKIFKEMSVSNFKFPEKKAVFGIYTKDEIKAFDGNNLISPEILVDVIETDENGILKNNIELPEGNYYVKELYVSRPYKLLPDHFDFTVDYISTNDEDVVVVVNGGQIENEPSIGKFEMLVYPDEIYDEENVEDLIPEKPFDPDNPVDPNDPDNPDSPNNPGTQKQKLEHLGEEYGIEGKTYTVYFDENCETPVMTNDDTEAQFVTDADGKIYVPDIPTGVYYLKETKAPYGYELSDEVIKIEIEDGKMTLFATKEPYKKAKLLEKEDGFTKDIISGVKFEILNENKEVIYTGVTDESGILEVPIVLFENGKKYYYREVEAPELYNIDKDRLVEFTANVDTENCEWLLDTIVVDNDRKTKKRVTLQKVDKDTGEPLPDCEFYIVLVDEDGNEYVNRFGDTVYLEEHGVTDENGEFFIDDVPYGEYKFEELTAPEGYEPPGDEQRFHFTVEEESPDEQHYVVKDRKKRRVTLQKVDEETGEPLPDCEFYIVELDENGNEKVDENGNVKYLVEHGVTDENGEYYLDNVPEGHYRFVELTVPDGYEPPSDKQIFEFSIDSSSPTEQHFLVEDKKSKKFTVKKVDKNTREPLPYCEFYIVELDENGNEKVDENGNVLYLVEHGYTDENGEFYMDNVPEGHYRFVEVTAPDGYVPPGEDQIFEFSIDVNSPEMQYFIVEDEKWIDVNTGDIEITNIVTILVISVFGIIGITKIKRNKEKNI